MKEEMTKQVEVLKSKSERNDLPEDLRKSLKDRVKVLRADKIVRK